jgi:hypothetical protein
MKNAQTGSLQTAVIYPEDQTADSIQVRTSIDMSIDFTCTEDTNGKCNGHEVEWMRRNKVK